MSCHGDCSKHRVYTRRSHDRLGKWCVECQLPKSCFCSTFKRKPADMKHGLNILSQGSSVPHQDVAVNCVDNNSSHTHTHTQRHPHSHCSLPSLITFTIHIGNIQIFWVGCGALSSGPTLKGCELTGCWICGCLQFLSVCVFSPQGLLVATIFCFFNGEVRLAFSLQLAIHADTQAHTCARFLFVIRESQQFPQPSDPPSEDRKLRQWLKLLSQGRVY